MDRSVRGKTHILQIFDGTCRPWVKVTTEINDVISLVDVCERTVIPLEHLVERETFGEREKCATSVKRAIIEFSLGDCARAK